MTSTASLYSILTDVYDSGSQALKMVISIAHTHAGASSGGQLDWDNIWSDAVHSHGTNTEGGTLDHGVLTGLTDDDHPQYQKESLFTAAGDIAYASGSATWASLPIGSALYVLRVNSAGTSVEWALGTQTKEFTASIAHTSGTSASYGAVNLYGGQYADCVFYAPADLSTITSATALLIPGTTGTLGYTALTAWGGSGELITAGTAGTTVASVAGTAQKLQSLSFTNILGTVTAGDAVSLYFRPEEVTGSKSVTFFGLKIKYS